MAPPLAAEGLGEALRVALSDNDMTMMDQMIDGHAASALDMSVSNPDGWMMDVTARLPCS